MDAQGACCLEKSKRLIHYSLTMALADADTVLRVQWKPLNKSTSVPAESGFIKRMILRCK